MSPKRREVGDKAGKRKSPAPRSGLLLFPRSLYGSQGIRETIKEFSHLARFRSEGYSSGIRVRWSHADEEAAPLIEYEFATAVFAREKARRAGAA